LEFKFTIVLFVFNINIKINIMKKLFFTAVAVIAFNGVSVAAIVNEKAVETIEIKILNSEGLDLKNPPAGWYDVECSNGASFHGYYNGQDGIYGWAGAICRSMAQ
jgi:hypothetical protein